MNVPIVQMSGCCRWLAIVAVFSLCWMKPCASAEIIFGDSFDQAAGNVTNSTPFLDVQGDGWQIPSGANPLDSDGQGHLFAAATAGGAASVPLIPIGPHGVMTATATMQLPPGTLHWIGFGFANGNEMFHQFRQGARAAHGSG